MNRAVAVAVCLVFLALALWHVWLALIPRSTAAEAAAVPTVAGKPLFAPSRRATLAVAMALVAFAGLVAATADLISLGYLRPCCHGRPAHWRSDCWLVRWANSGTSDDFWPGGDRDGNPFVNADTTLKVANALRQAAVKCYYLDVRKLKRRLTFKGVDIALAALEKKLYDNLFLPDHQFNLKKEEILDSLHTIQKQLVEEHSSLFVELVESLITKVEVFGLHFASLDVRQESSIHGKALNSLAAETNSLPANYASLTDEEKMNALFNITTPVDSSILEDEVERDTVQSAAVMKTIQQSDKGFKEGRKKRRSGPKIAPDGRQNLAGQGFGQRDDVGSSADWVIWASP